MTRVQFLNASEEINKRPNEYWTLVMDIARQNTLARITKCCQIMGRSESDNLSASQIFYPCMQCADIFFLKVAAAPCYYILYVLGVLHAYYMQLTCILPAQCVIILVTCSPVQCGAHKQFQHNENVTFKVATGVAALLWLVSNYGPRTSALNIWIRCSHVHVAICMLM